MTGPRLVLVVAGALAAAVGAGLHAIGPGVDGTEVEAGPPASVMGQATAMLEDNDADGPEAWAATALARPLFTPGRHPAAADAPLVAAATAALPRLSGVLIAGAVRRAFFAAPDGTRVVTAVVGNEIAGLRVERIEGSGVTVSGPGGRRVLTPRFDTRASLPIAPPALDAPSAFSAVPTLQQLRAAEAAARTR